MHDLLVAEIFGSLQGEGPSCGQLATFLRLSRCNLSCSWCDTPYTWDTSRFDLRTEARRMSVVDAAHRVLSFPGSLVVVTGGEPLLYQDRLTWFVDRCRADGRRVEVETNGTIAPSVGMLKAVQRWNVSPKLANSNLPESKRIRPDALRLFKSSGRAVFKFVVSSADDLAEVEEIERRYELAPIWIMPQGVSADRIVSSMRELVDDVIKRGWNLTPRLHVLLWDNERGR